MGEFLYKDFVHVTSRREVPVTIPLTTFPVAKGIMSHSNRDSVGRPGLDPGALRVFPEYPGTSLNVQICWPEGVECPPMFADVISRLNSWLDSWLDQGSFQGRAIIRFRGADGEVVDLQLGEGVKGTNSEILIGAPLRG
jgi:hypothetical protein